VEIGDAGGPVFISSGPISGYVYADVNNNGVTTPLDVLLLVNAINSGLAVAGESTYYVDVNNDRHLTPLDALLVVNYLNNPDPVTVLAAIAAEGEATSPLPVAPISPYAEAASPLVTASPMDHERPATTADGLDPRETIPASELRSSAGFLSEDDSPASLELDPILSDLAADVDDVWRAIA